MQQILALTRRRSPGVNKLDVVGAWVTWLQGKSAMIYSWPPTGRMSENYAQRDKAFSFLPKSQIVGKVGYAVIPGKNGEHAWRLRQVRSLPTRRTRSPPTCSRNGRPSPSISLPRVMLPVHVARPVSDLALQVGAVPEPLAGRQGVPDRPQQRREQRGHRHDHAGWRTTPSRSTACAPTSGPATTPRRRCSKAAAEWDATTEKLGVDSQKARLCGVHEAARRRRREHDREAGRPSNSTEQAGPLTGALAGFAGECL